MSDNRSVPPNDTHHAGGACDLAIIPDAAAASRACVC